MTDMLNRRTSGRRFSPALARPRCPAVAAAAQSRKLQIGCTALIWGARAAHAGEPDDRGQGHGARSGSTASRRSRRSSTTGTRRARSRRSSSEHRIPLVSAYATVQLTDTSTRKENLAQLIQWGKALKKHGGRFMVLAPNGVKREGYNFAEHQRQHRRRPQRLREGDERRRAWRRPASAHRTPPSSRATKPTR